MILEKFKKLQATNNSSSARSAGALVGDDDVMEVGGVIGGDVVVEFNVAEIGALIGDDVVVEFNVTEIGALIGDVVVVEFNVTEVGAVIGDDVVEVGALIGDENVGTEDEQLRLPLASKQHAHATLAQSIRISSLKTEHKADGIVPANCVLLNNHKPVSSVNPPNDDGTVPIN